MTPDTRCPALARVRCVLPEGHVGPHESRTSFVDGSGASSQSRVSTWVRSTFSEQEAQDVPERSLRMVEETIELAQACKVDASTVHRLVDYVFSRPVGEPNQELAGCMVTLYALAVALDLDADAELETELERINRPEVIERCRRRQHEKRAALVAVPRTSSGLEGPKRTSAVQPPTTLDQKSENLVASVVDYLKTGLPPHPSSNTLLLGALDSGLNLAGHVETPATRAPECACGRPSMHESGWCGTQCIGSLGVR